MQFISTATKNENVVIGHGLNPATLKIQPIDIQHPEEKYRIVFVDTPGFDDACKSDTEIFTMVAEWFKELSVHCIERITSLLTAI